MTYNNWPTNGDASTPTSNGEGAQWHGVSEQRGQAPYGAAQHVVAAEQASAPATAPEGPGTTPKGTVSVRTLWFVIAAAVVAVALALILPPLLGGALAPNSAGDAGATEASDAANSAFTGNATLTDTQSWAARVYDSYDTITESGTGDFEFTLPIGVRSGVVTVTHNHDSSLSVKVVEAADDSHVDTLFSVRGPVKETAFWGYSEYDEAKKPKVKIEAGGDWTIQFTSFDKAPEFTGSGTGTGAYLYLGGDDAFTASYTGEDMLSLWAIGTDDERGSQLLSEYGPFQERLLFPKGPALLLIEADGEWTFTP